MFEVRNYWYPKQDKAGELRKLLQEMAKHRQAQGQMTSVSEQLFSHEGRVFVVSFWDRDLAAFEERRHHNRTGAEVLSYLAQANELCNKQRMELYEILVPFPSA